MKYWQTALAILAAVSASLALADDFKTIDGKEYKAAKVSRVEPDGIVITFRGGVVKIPFTELPKDVQERFGYDAAKIEVEQAAERAAEEKRIDEQKAAERELAQATVTPTASPTLTATTTSNQSAADAEAGKLLKDPEWHKLVEEERKFQPGTPEWRQAYEKVKAYEEKVAPTFSKKIAEEASIKYLRGGGSGTVSVARDEVALKAAKKAGDSHDVEGIALMLQSGELFSVPVGTKVRDLGETHWAGTAERGMLVTKVRILEGEHYAKAGWVPDQWLQDAKP